MRWMSRRTDSFRRPHAGGWILVRRRYRSKHRGDSIREHAAMRRCVRCEATRQRREALAPFGYVVLQARMNEPDDIGRQIGPQCPYIWRLRLKDGRHYFTKRLSVERQMPARALVEDDSERPDVRFAVDVSR